MRETWPLYIRTLSQGHAVNFWHTITAGFSPEVSDPGSWLFPQHGCLCWKRSEIQINHFPPLGNLLKMSGGEGVEANGLSEVFPHHLWFPWLHDRKVSWITLLLLDSSAASSSSSCLCRMLLSPWLDPFFSWTFFPRKWTSFLTFRRVQICLQPQGLSWVRSPRLPPCWASLFGIPLLEGATLSMSTIIPSHWICMLRGQKLVFAETLLWFSLWCKGCSYSVNSSERQQLTAL